MFEQISEVFYEEANELLDSLEEYLLTLEKEPDNLDTISAIFRAMHTIKGSSSMFGFDHISKFTHTLENTFDLIRNGKATVSPNLITLTLQARDHIRTLLSNEPTSELENASQFIIEEIESCIKQSSIDEPQLTDTIEDDNQAKLIQEDSSKEEDTTPQEHSYRISFVPSETILLNGTRPYSLIKELCSLGQATVTTFTDKLPPLSSLDTDLTYLYWEVILTTTKKEDDIRDVFIFVDESSTVTIEKITDTSPKLVGEILVSRKLVSEDDLHSTMNEQKKIGELLVSKNLASEQQVAAAVAEQKHFSKIQQEKELDSKLNTQNTNAQNTSIRVNSKKLDQLIDLVGELVTFNARLNSVSQNIKNSTLTALSELSESLIFSLRDTSMDMRMIPIGSIFPRFRRLVHDLSKDLGKNIDLVIEGSETELDKNVIEKLNDPLVHLLRNSCDHGIETPDIRAQNEKSLTGTVTLSAKHAGAFVLITISDDGKGIDKDVIYKKALEKKLISPSEKLTDSQIYELIFLPGFSTNDKVTSISGRGVGMDVVKKDIDSLGGSVSIETSLNKGTTFILKIPLTLAIIDGMLVQIGNNKYVIPVSSIVECIEYKNVSDENALCTSIINRDEYLPCINMRNYFELDCDKPKEQQVVVVNDQTSKIGIVVDQIIGNHQTVIKPLGKFFKKISGLSGSTILGDGSIALILDIFKLSDFVRKLDINNKKV